MADINISKTEIPFLLGGTGGLAVHAAVSNPTAKLEPTDDDLLSVTFGLAGEQDFSFGAGNSVKLGVKAGTNANLTPLWRTSSPSRLAVLADHGLADYFAAHRDDLILILSLGANADANVAGSFTYSFLTATATLEAGASAGYIYSRSYPADKPLQGILLNFFSGLRLPANVTTAPSPGEVVGFEYSGYLKLGAELSVGYELKGSPSIDIGQLLLSEHYQLSVIGNLALGASVAGNFAVEVRSAVDASGASMPDWARVIVRKKRASQFNIAADVSVDASSDLQGLPDTPNEFLGALLGVNAKNWLNMITQVGERVRHLSDLPTLQTELDTLATNFLNEWIGKASDKLSNTEFNSFLQRVQKVVESYKSLDNSAITLFDRYFNVAGSKIGVLTEKLNQLKALTSWDQFKGKVDPELWAIVQRLTGGDPLNWILGRIEIPGPSGKPITVPSLPELQKRVQQTLDLIQGDAHDEIRKVIALAKSKFPLDGFLNSLSTVDSIPKLKALAEDKLGGFIERLIGKGIGQLSNSDLGQTITRLHKILDAAKNFEDNVYAKFKEAAKQSFSFKLHSEYSRASEREALIDVMINLTSDQGKALMRAAGHGDFQDILAGFRPELVQINSGVLTHKVTKQSAFSVNVVGWHRGWHYQEMDRVIVAAEQQIKAEGNGAVTVFTTIDMTRDKERKRNGERMFTSFLLRFLGESHGVLAFDKANQQYLLDAITGMAASYGLSFDDPKTSARELSYYLSFASDFGLTTQGATLQDLRAVLPEKAPDDFGPIGAEYEVRYTEPGLRALFSAPTPDDAIRQIMRKIVLANYVRESDNLARIGWCYWTQGVFDIWKQGQAEFTNHSSLELKPIHASPFANLSAPDKVALDRTQLFVLSTLFFIEEKMVEGLQKLQTMIQGAGSETRKIQPHEFENALSKIGDALKDFDDFDEGVNTVFAVFDQLINLRTPAGKVRASSLKLVSQVDSDGTPREVTKMFIAQPEVREEGLVAGSATP